MKWKVRWVRDSFMALGIVGALAVAEGSYAVAQTATPTLTVRPREMATGTRNPATGEYPLSSVPSAIVSVPPQCGGTRRCPLFIFLPGGGQSASLVTDWLRPVADKYGIILLAPSWGHFTASEIDAALRETLQRFAIDPEKIGISGRCASVGHGMQLGVGNPHIFSRIGLISGHVPTAGRTPQNKTTEFYIDAGHLESGMFGSIVSELRRNGNPVKHVVSLRHHEHQAEDYDFLGRWLHESWTKPNPASRTVPSVIADPLPLLTAEVLTKMTTFWTRFFQEPDSIRTTARRAHIRDVVVPIGRERPVVPMVDMSALAARYPSVAAALKTAGLTAQQHDAYRAALVSAIAAKNDERRARDTEETPVLAKNLAFINEHPNEMAALAMAGIKDSMKLDGIGRGSTNPKQIEQMRPLGIWRTP